MKIYRVTAGHVRTVWTNYQSAAQSHAYWLKRDPSAVLDSAHVPDDAWKPVDKRTETRLSQVQYLWEQLVQSDPQGLDSLLDELVKRVAPKQATVKPALDTDVKREAQALLDMDRLVSR